MVCEVKWNIPLLSFQLKTTLCTLLSHWDEIQVMPNNKITICTKKQNHIFYCPTSVYHIVSGLFHTSEVKLARRKALYKPLAELLHLCHDLLVVPSTETLIQLPNNAQSQSTEFTLSRMSSWTQTLTHTHTHTKVKGTEGKAGNYGHVSVDERPRRDILDFPLFETKN